MKAALLAVILTGMVYLSWSAAALPYEERPAQADLCQVAHELQLEWNNAHTEEERKAIKCRYLRAEVECASLGKRYHYGTGSIEDAYQHDKEHYKRKYDESGCNEVGKPSAYKDASNSLTFSFALLPFGLVSALYRIYDL